MIIAFDKATLVRILLALRDKLSLDRIGIDFHIVVRFSEIPGHISFSR